MRYLSIIMLLVVLFVACGKKYLYNHSIEVPKQGWNKNNMAKFDVELKDTSLIYNFLVTIDNNNSYPYRNIWFFVDTYSPQNIRQRDTFNVVLANRKGQWYGKKSGNLFSLQSAFRKYIKIKETGLYKIEIQQGMRKDILEGIEKIGLQIEEVKIERE